MLSNDCVIIPGFGGFMTHHLEARYDEEDHTFLPPLRTLGFNPQLTMNDSLLAQSYVEAYDLSYPEALRRIEGEVEELRQHLENEGSYELNDIGVISLNNDGRYTFLPCEAGILTPELYGLGTFEMMPKAAEATKVVELVKSDVSEPAVQAEDTPQLDEESTIDGSDDDKALVIKISWIRNAVAVAAAVIGFLLMTTPVSNSDTSNMAITNLNNPAIFSTPKTSPESTKISIVKDTLAKQVTKTDSVITTKPSTEAKETVEIKKDTTTYCIVLASYVTKKNAQLFVDRLQKKGYEDSEVYIRNNVTRVVYGKFKTLNDAYNHLNRVQDDADFKEAWVLKTTDRS